MGNETLVLGRHHRDAPIFHGQSAWPMPTAWRVVRAESNGKVIPTKVVESVLETTPAGSRWHVRVPLGVRPIGSPQVLLLSQHGLTLELEATVP